MSGDESALDMFNWKKGKSGVMIGSSLGSSESLAFFVAGASGKNLFTIHCGRWLSVSCITSMCVIN